MHYQRWHRYGDVNFVPERIRILEPGERFGRLVVKHLTTDRADGKRVYVCVCDCGNETEVRSVCLKRGTTRSCGCLKREWSARLNRTHGMSKHPLYVTWCCMRSRCLQPNQAMYADYGGRGITIDPRWDDFARFVADVGEKPGPGYMLDRIDNDGPYSPENCRWADPMTSSKNKRAHGEGKRAQWRERALPAAEAAIRAYGRDADAHDLAVVVVDAIAAATHYTRAYDASLTLHASKRPLAKR